MSLTARAAALPVLAIALVAGVLGVQLAHGGDEFVPLQPADPCAVRAVASTSSGIDGLTEELVLLGLDGAACQLGVTREALILQLAQQGQASDAQVDALRAGLLHAVDQMQAQGDLPPASDLVDEALDRSNLNGLLKTAIRALPDSVIDNALKTDDVLRRTINKLDLRAVLANLNSSDDLNKQINSAITKAVEQALIARLRDIL
jgi:hypothetical protein